MRQSIIYIKGFSDLASRMDTIVLSALVYHLTSSVWWLSASLAAGVLGGLLSSIASGVLADRMDRRKLMIYSDLLRALLILLIIPLPYPVTILFVRFGLGFLTSFFEVSFQAEIPQIFKHKNIFSTNALMARLSSIAMILGFFSGGAISNFIGYQAVIYFDCFSFIVSAAVLWRFKWSFPEDTQENLPTKNNRFWQSLLADIHEVKDYLSLRIVMYVVFVVYLIDTFGSGSHNVGIPLLADQLTPGRQEFTYGLIWSIWGQGNV